MIIRILLTLCFWLLYTGIPEVNWPLVSLGHTPVLIYYLLAVWEWPVTISQNGHLTVLSGGLRALLLLRPLSQYWPLPFAHYSMYSYARMCPEPYDLTSDHRFSSVIYANNGHHTISAISPLSNDIYLRSSDPDQPDESNCADPISQRRLPKSPKSASERKHRRNLDYRKRPTVKETPDLISIGGFTGAGAWCDMARHRDDQWTRFQNDPFFRRLTRESDVRYAGLPLDRPLDQRRRQLEQDVDRGSLLVVSKVVNSAFPNHTFS